LSVVKNYLSLICDDAESHSLYQHPVYSSRFYYSLYECINITRDNSLSDDIMHYQ